MSEVSTRPSPARGILALTVALGLSVPLGLAAPSAAVPTREVLLTSTESLDQLAADVALAGGRVVQTYDIASALLAELPESVTAPQGSFAIPNVAMKFNSAPATVSSDSANTFKETIGAPAAGGSGVKVAVVDTGVDPDADITVSDRINVSGDVDGDGYGHGTFMAGLVAGDDADFGGVAPDAAIVDVQVAAADGSTDLARVLAGLQAVADKRASDPSLDVMMLALSAQSPLPPHVDPLTVALDRLWDSGMTVVVASGNDGPNSVLSPASNPTLMVVGAQDERDTADRADDVVADFSSYGKAFGFARPDVVAPGVSLISASPLGSTAYADNPTSQVAEGYLKGTGTSMSAAVAAGAAAVLLSERPALTPDQAKALFVQTAYRNAALTEDNGAGAGGLDLQAALSADVGKLSVPKGPSSQEFAPDEADAATWAVFAQAWLDRDLKAVAAAWSKLTPQTRKWAANAWSLQSLIRALQADSDSWAGRRWAGRRWATEDWNGRRWATDEWVGRRWANEEWLASVWDGRRWAGRRWAADDWLAFAWTLRMVTDDAAIQQMWDSDEWEGRRWASFEWVGRRWASDAWDGRRWADFSWDGRRWASDVWDGRRWADFAFEGRRWATSTWDGRRWAVNGW